MLLRGNDLATVSEREMARVRGGQISTVYQDPMSSLNPLMTVGRQITEAIAAHEGVGRREARERAIQVLGDVGLPQPARRIDDHPHQFSGGMRPRDDRGAGCGSPTSPSTLDSPLARGGLRPRRDDTLP